MSTTAAGTRSWPKERRSQTGPYSNDRTTIGPAGSERRPPRCPLTKGPKSPKVADDVQAVTENGDSEVMFSPLEFAGLRVCPHHPDDSRREIHHTFVQETFPNQIQAWRRRMANLEGVFKRLGDEEFGSSEVMEWPVAERLAAVKGLVSGLARDFGIEDAPVAANDEVVEAWLRTLTGRAKAGA